MPILHKLSAVASAAVLGTLAGCAQPPPVSAVTISAIPPGQARIWFYRDYEPSESLNTATVNLNGMPAAYVRADGSATYRDVPPGRYDVAVQSFGQDIDQSKDIDLAAGQEKYVKILSLSAWTSGGDKTSFQRDTFYVSLVPPQIARAAISAHPFAGGS